MAQAWLWRIWSLLGVFKSLQGASQKDEAEKQMRLIARGHRGKRASTTDYFECERTILKDEITGEGSLVHLTLTPNTSVIDGHRGHSLRTGWRNRSTDLRRILERCRPFLTTHSN